MPLSQEANWGPPGAWVAAHGLPPGGALLDAGGPTRAPARYAALCLDPEAIWVHPEPTGAPFAALEAFAAAARGVGWAGVPGPRPLVICALSYDLGRTVERLPGEALADSPLPAAWAARYRAAYVWDRQSGRGRIVAQDSPAAQALADRLAAGGPPPAPPRLGAVRPERSPAAHQAAVRAALAHIGAGEVYQVNLSTRFVAPLETPGDPVALFAALHAQSPAPFAAALRLDAERAILSVSPERFLAWDADGRVETRPIKGTRPRSDDPVADDAAVADLLASAKDAAEHIMIVDLERNDLGRVCQTGTVRVSRLRAVESYATVHHLVSDVVGQRRPEVGDAALLRALFPGGSVTGAPKARAMELIERLEPVRRGIYCGAVGYLDAAGGGDLNLPIRTAWTTADAVYYQSGGGIVADSDPADEWSEVLAKARAFTRMVAG